MRWSKLRPILLLSTVISFLLVLYLEKNHSQKLYSLYSDQRVWQQRVDIQSTILQVQTEQIAGLNADVKELQLKVYADDASFSKRYIQSRAVSMPAVEDISSMRDFVTRLNNKGWQALKMFGRRRGTLHLLLVQVHSRHSLLSHLLTSLQSSLHEARYHGNTDNVMVVITHDMYTKELHSVVAEGSWTFNIVQLYFPCSVSLFNNTFPGTDPRDCPSTAQSSDCQNSQYPDLNGHYRDVKYTQIKHHFWWKLTAVRKVVPNAVLTMLEEDNYLSPDFFHLLDMMHGVSQSNYSTCDMMFLTTGSESELDNNPSFTKALSQTWTKISGYGFIMTPHLLNQLFTNYIAFCTMDDYNQDWTMFQLGGTVFTNPVTEVRLTQSRVFHTGACGFHYNNSDCEALLTSVKQYIAVNDHHYFPNALEIETHNTGPVLYKPLDGEWSDPRDHTLCERFYHKDFLTNYNYDMCIVNL